MAYNEKVAESQRMATRNLGEMGNEVSLQQEYVIGLLLGVVAARSLLPLCTSLLTAVIESIMNLKATFPSSAIAGYLLIFITTVSVPVFVSSFAFFIQTMGDPLLTAACGCVAAYLSLSMLTGYRIIHMHEDELQRLYNVFWVEYGLRVLLAGAALALFVAWTFGEEDRNSVRSYVMEELLKPVVVLGLLVGFFRGKAASAVAGTDMLMSSVGDAILWTEENDQAGHRACIQVLQSLRVMGDPSQHPQTKACEVHPSAHAAGAPQWNPQQAIQVELPTLWRCAGCQFDNRAAAAQCGMCGSIRPLLTPRLAPGVTPK